MSNIIDTVRFLEELRDIIGVSGFLRHGVVIIATFHRGLRCDCVQAFLRSSDSVVEKLLILVWGGGAENVAPENAGREKHDKR